MEYEKIILDLITPLVTVKDDLKVIMMDQENLYETNYIVYCNEHHFIVFPFFSREKNDEGYKIT